MPRIYTSQVSANSLRSNAQGPRSSATGAAFGQNVGLANQALGNDIQRAGNVASDITIRNQNKRKEQEIANAVAMHDTTEKQLKLRNEVGEDGDTYNERVREMYIDDVENYTNEQDDDYVREQVRTRLMSRLPSVSSTAAQYEVGLEAEASVNATNESLSTLSNRVRIDPINYDQYVQDGENVIAASSEVPEALKASMKRNWRNDSARKRFDGLIEGAGTIEGLDTISRDLAGEGDTDWQKELAPADFDTLLNQVGSARKQFATKLGANARAGLASLQGRIDGSTDVADMLVPSNELEQVQGYVKQYTLASNDGELNKRMGRFMRDQEIIRTNIRLPIEEIRSQINRTNGRPNVAYPDMPPVLSGAINEAQEKFGISASYLGAKIQREYGQFLKKPTIKAGKRFRPQTLNDGVDLEQLPHDALNAATVAGQAIGTPVVLGAPSNAPLTDGISISTVGMGSTEKIKMTQALVDAGFTGFAEVDGFLQVNMTQQIPETFGEQEGKFWGGWTDLSPEVSEVLLSKGYEPGKASTDIKRKNAIIREDEIDFGRGTTIKKADGTAGSSALGVMQFIKGTWLDLMRDDNVTSTMGIDTSSMSDAELLKLRADPRVSVMAGAAYAQQNQKILEGSLNRQVNDAELYMAHFLGPQGALGLITANRNTPGGLAAKLFPSAAASNRPVFYEGNRMKTVQEVVSDISRTIGLSPSQVTFEDNQLRGKLATKMEKSLKSNMIEHVAQTGTFDVPALDSEGGFKARGALMTSAADYYRIPMGEAKAFTDDEVTFLQKRVSNGSVDDNLELMAEIRSMGEEQSVAAFNQIGKFEPTFAHAGDLYAQGNGGVAADIVRGQKRLDENPTIRTQIGATEQDVQDAFVGATEGALFDVSPADREAVQQAAFAHYLQRMSKGNKLKFKSGDYANSVQAVMGGSDDSPAIDYVNGRATVLPRGVDADLVENALDRMDVSDWAAMSTDGKPPRYRDGTIVNPQDVRDEAMLRAIGGGQYHVMLDDGSRLVTDDFTGDGRPKAFVFAPDADKLKRISDRPVAFSQRKLPNSPFLD